MGNFLSGALIEHEASTSDCNLASESETMESINCLHNSNEPIEEQFHDTVSDDEETRAKSKEAQMNEFKKELDIKREQRKTILARHKAEKKALEDTLQNEIESKVDLCERNQLLRELLIKNNIEVPDNLQSNNEKSYIADSISHMREEIEKLRTNNVKLRCDLASSNSALQAAYSDIAELSAQNTESIKQVNALKEVISVSKTMISLREQQLNELKSKLSEIERSLADRETNMLSTDLRQEYERQLQNIRTLRGLYEERARLADVSRQAISRDLDEHKRLLEAEVNKCKDLTSKVEQYEEKINNLEECIQDKNNTISTSQNEIRHLKAEMLGINKMFSQALLGYKNKQDLDKLVHRLEENHGLLTHMAGQENCPETSTELPKLLLEIVDQIDEKDNENFSDVTHEEKTHIQINSNPSDISKADEIAQNLPKVWRVLMELLSHQSEADTNSPEKVTTCYKSVDTKSGPVLVPSVSQTYIRLKDLILEKLALIKEVNRMKQLNTHLESRLEEQEKRLCLVTNELSKTWHVVGRLRRHHHQLHTHEKILKYELQQKRKLLNELKEELEYCREKWEQAREKNSQSEKDWRKLRTEFSNRKLKPEASFNNSAESGYSDERPSDSESNDESEYVGPKVKCKKKVKKSFETAVDSSTDFNLAEREDPPSDMLDIAELPLDTHDNSECVYDNSTCEKLLKTENCEETEDEIGDIHNETNVEEQLKIEKSLKKSNIAIEKKLKCENIQHEMCNIPGTSTGKTIVNLDITLPKINEVNQRVINNENSSKSSKSECSSNNEEKLTKEITSNNVTKTDVNSKQINSSDVILTEKYNRENSMESVERSFANEISTGSRASEFSGTTANVENNSESIKEVDFAAILENVRKQNERLQLKDKRLENLEEGCSTTLANLSGTLQSGDNMIDKLNTMHLKYEVKGLDHGERANTSEENKTVDTEEASCSHDIDHEARFAARDLRLKRLEEQTKSLVNKVNKTASKGVKIHYKLEELHNIYGSENSRSGTPSEDTSEDISQNDDDVQND